MRFLKCAVPFMLAFCIASAHSAEKSDNKIHGELAAPPAGATAGIVGVLTVKGHAKPGADAPAPKMYNLVAEGDVAKKVTDMIGKKVDVTGSGTQDSYKVETIGEHVRKEKTK